MTIATYEDLRIETEAARERANALIADLERERAGASLDSQLGLSGAADRLADLETRLAEAHRTRDRAGLSLQEIARREEAERLAAAEADRTDLERRHANLLQARTHHLSEVQRITGDLADAVTTALAADHALLIVAGRLGWQPDQRTANRIGDYIGLALNSVGLRDMPRPPEGLRGPLVPTATATEEV